MKIGDTVRYLNAVGGGTVTRIEGQMAYVDEDGFETPVLARECVVVSSPAKVQDTHIYKEETVRKPEPPLSVPHDAMPRETEIEETPEGEKLNITLGFEPADIKRLSTTTFDAYLVNDSNYALYATISTRGADSEKWTLRYAGFIEPAMQEFVFELTVDDLPDVDRVAVQAVPFKRHADYTLKHAIDFEQRLDATKFARLHCFDTNPYFDTKVLALTIVKDDVTSTRTSTDALKAPVAAAADTRGEGRPRPRFSKPAQRPATVEVDLHAGALLDNLNGLSKADILNYQVDRFRKVMDENLRYPGTKLIFIHGKGEGVLRQAIMKELNHRYKGHDVADASFREYGFGATQVTIRKQKS